MELEAFFPYIFATASEGFSRRLAEVYGKEHGLSREEWRLLFLIARAGKVDSVALAERTTLDRVQVTRASQRLETKGLIDRATPDHDRRLRIYTCTDAGRTLFEETLPKVHAMAEVMLSRLSDADRRALEQGVKALATSLRET